MKEKEEAVPTKPKNSEIPTRARDFKAEMRAEMMKRRTIPGYEGKNIFSVSEEDLEALKQYDEVKERMRAEMTRRRVRRRLKKAQVISANSPETGSLLQRALRHSI